MRITIVLNKRALSCCKRNGTGSLQDPPFQQEISHKVYLFLSLKCTPYTNADIHTKQSAALLFCSTAPRSVLNKQRSKVSDLRCRLSHTCLNLFCANHTSINTSFMVATLFQDAHLGLQEDSALLWVTMQSQKRKQLNLSSINFNLGILTVASFCPRES